VELPYLYWESLLPRARNAAEGKGPLFSSLPSTDRLLLPPQQLALPRTTSGGLSSLYDWEGDAGRGLPPCPCYCSVNTHNAPPPPLFTDVTRRLITTG
jgi:hypothetical protein